VGTDLGPAQPTPTPDIPWRWRADDGLSLAGRWWRGPQPRSAPPVLLLHGLASNLTRWAEFVDHTRLKESHDLLRVDLRGHGESPTWGAIGLERWSQDLVAALDELQAPKATLIGHSLGAQVALRMAARHPQRVAAMVLIDPVFRGALRGGNLRRAQSGPLFAGLAALVRLGYRLGLHRRELAALDLWAMDRQARAALAAGPAAEAAFIAHYSSARADLKSFRTAHYLQEMAEVSAPAPDPATLTMPTLVLLSTGATFASLEDSRPIAERFVNGTVQTVDCHHWPLTERPQEVREQIERWIAATPQAAAPVRSA
jgi:pimeloyl-ACP methyl ester carboxylesterase